VFLSSFPAVYSELLKLFDVREVANLVQDTLGSLPTIMHVDDSLQAVKLQCIGKTVESQLYTNPGRVQGSCIKKATIYIRKFAKYFLKKL
jgi:dedicator of cytokinesis protein 4